MVVQPEIVDSITLGIEGDQAGIEALVERLAKLGGRFAFTGIVLHRTLIQRPRVCSDQLRESRGTGPKNQDLTRF